MYMHKVALLPLVVVCSSFPSGRSQTQLKQTEQHLFHSWPPNLLRIFAPTNWLFQIRKIAQYSLLKTLEEAGGTILKRTKRSTAGAVAFGPPLHCLRA
jgi:hypothetical protein